MPTPPPATRRAPLPGAARLAGWLPALAVGRPVAVGMGLLALLVVGAIAWQRIPLQLLPSGYSPPFLYAHLPVSASTPAELEQSVALPVEDYFGTLHGLERLRTFVRTDSVGFLLQFADGTDMDLAYLEVMDRLDRAWPGLPEGTRRPYLWKHNPQDDPVIWFGVALPAQGGDLHGRLQDHLVAPLERLPGVSRVELAGTQAHIVRVAVDGERARALGVQTVGLARALAGRSFTRGVGVLRQSGRAVSVRVPARLSGAEELARVRIPTPGDSLGVPLAQIATVRSVRQGTERLLRVDGRPGVTVGVYKESTANTVEVARAVRAALRRLPSYSPELEGIGLHVFFDQGAIIDDSLAALRESGLWGGILALMVLLLFLRRPGMTTIVALAIPLSLLFALVALWARGDSLNILSLMGLMLSIGLVVDNAIVVVESIHVQRMQGVAPRRAAQLGATEVALALLTATSTTIVAFLPLLLMAPGEQMSYILGAVGFPVWGSLAASLVVALLLIPMGAALLPGGARVKGASKPRRPGDLLGGVYGRLLRRALVRRPDGLLLAALVALSALPLLGRLQVTDRLEGNLNDVHVSVTLPSASRSEDRLACAHRFEQYFERNRQRFGLRTLLVRQRGSNSNSLGVRAFLHPAARQPMPRKELLDTLREEMPACPGARQHIGWRRSAGEQGGVSVVVSGPESSRLPALADAVTRRLRREPVVLSVESPLDQAAGRELHLDVAGQQAAWLGVQPLMVAGTVGYATAGYRLFNLALEGREVEVWLRLQDAEQMELQRLDDLVVTRVDGASPAAPGGPALASDAGAGAGELTVRSLAQPRWVPGLGELTREDRRSVVTLRVTAAEQDLRRLGDALDRVLADVPVPRGYSLSKGERFARLKRTGASWQWALVLAGTFVFLLMGVLFESTLLPLAVAASVPFALAGAVWGLWATATPFDTMAATGLILLVGIVVNNAIVLVDRIVRLRRQGLERTEAIVRGCHQRLRPVLMTTLTTVCGLVPLAMGSRGIVGIPYFPLARTVIAGLAVSTLFTLLLVPLLYSLLDDLGGWATRSARGLWQRWSGRC